jgi:hypothetical protein
MTTKRSLLATAILSHAFFGPDDDKFDMDSQLDKDNSKAVLTLEDETKDDDKDDKKQDPPPPKKTEKKSSKADTKSEFDLKLEEADKKKDDNEGDDEEDDDDEDDEDKLDNKKQREEKKKNSKEESTKILRKERDDAREALKKYGNLTPELAQEFSAFLDSRFKDKITSPDEIKGEFLLVTEKDDTITKLQNDIAEKDRLLADIDIRMSPEFKKDYADPYNEAGNNLFLEIANLNGQGQAIGMQSTQAFFDFLIKTPDLDGVKVKQQFAKFAADFEKETGEKYTAPPLGAVMTSLRIRKEKEAAFNKAYGTWGETKKQSLTKRQAEEEQMMKDATARNERMRRSQAQDAMRKYDRKEIEGFMDEETFVKSFNEEYKFVEGFMKDPTKTPTFEDLMIRGWKARNFDNLLKEFKELKAFKDEHDKQEMSGSRGGGGDPKKRQKDDDDWDDGRLDR